MSSTPIATQMWYDEIDKPGYNFGKPGYQSGTGHFTQLVWKGSTELGCAVSSDGVYVACRYCNGAGNYTNKGRFEANVLHKLKKPTGKSYGICPDPSKGGGSGGSSGGSCGGNQGPK